MTQLPPPAYSEKASVSSALPQTTTPATLAQSFSTARTNRIEETIVTSIYPHLESAAHRGIARTTLVLLPTDLTTSLDVDNKETANTATVIGFPSDEFVQLIYLPYTAGTLEFWRQANVIPDLVRRLKSILGAAKDNVRSEAVAPIEDSVTSPTAAPRQGFFKRTWSKPKSAPEFQGIDTEINSTQPHLMPGEIDVSAAIQDVSFRVVTEMGLYETRTDKGVVVKMEIGA
ncbi:MAG: hypothetical protein GOMPHAMPRED_000046 [Gomphillus americanus]|uniref:Uncharacterized protein n=1 Tax=Gomphillus americanus TaxID=1940652 RepID=A0A8H3HUJ4_9LECA|nr:MAG: hypothetical protein GOMPHAMPRED_000046 [Gomphillus americanus]